MLDIRNETIIYCVFRVIVFYMLNCVGSQISLLPIYISTLLDFIMQKLFVV
jgi:hypothetical protein